MNLMKNLFEIDKSEKKRIIEMHKTATKNQYLNEQYITQNQNTSQIANPTFSLPIQNTINTANQRGAIFSSYPCLLQWLVNNYDRITNEGNSGITLNNYVTLFNNGTLTFVKDQSKYYSWNCDWFNKNIDNYIDSGGTKTYGNYEGSTKKYTTNKSVVYVQQALNKLGYNVGTDDGKFGPKTKKGLEDFQNKEGLQASLGNIDKSTMLSLIRKLKENNPNDSYDIQQGLGNADNPNWVPIDIPSDWNKFPCVPKTKFATASKLTDGTTAYKINNFYYYNNGRKKDIDTEQMSNYSCNGDTIAS